MEYKRKRNNVVQTRIPEGPQQVEIAKHGDSFEKLALAKQKRLVRPAAEILAEDGNERIRVELACFCSHKSIIKKLRHDSSKEVRKVARRDNIYFGRKAILGNK